MEWLIKKDLEEKLFCQFGITGYIEDYEKLQKYLEKHSEETIASSIRVYCSELNNRWEVGFYVNRSVDIPDYLIAGRVRESTEKERIKAI